MMRIVIRAVEFRRTGVDGGHLYLKGTCNLPEHGETDVYAYFRSRRAELRFERVYSGGPITVETKSVTFNPGTGASIREIAKWTSADDA